MFATLVVYSIAVGLCGSVHYCFCGMRVYLPLDHVLICFIYLPFLLIEPSNLTIRLSTDIAIHPSLHLSIYLSS